MVGWILTGGNQTMDAISHEVQSVEFGPRSNEGNYFVTTQQLESIQYIDSGLRLYQFAEQTFIEDRDEMYVNSMFMKKY